MTNSNVDTEKSGALTCLRPKRVAPASTSLWTAAGGILLLLSVFYVEYRFYVHYETKRDFDEFNQTMSDLAKLGAYPMQRSGNSAAQYRARQVARAFLDRCIVGQRFERKQIGRPC